MKDVVTASGPSNIAFVKYWGKRDDKLILPCNSSLSLTLDMKDENGKYFRAVTSVMRSKKLKDDVFYLNGTKQDLSDKDVLERFQIIDQLRHIAKSKDRLLVVSENSFPTGAGLASSAAGIAALVYATAGAFGLKLSEKELSIIARQGSGSSCRSVCGGFVVWNRGTQTDGRDSYAETVAPADHWPDIVDLVAIVSLSKKKVSSRAGMKQTVQTSPLYKLRPEYAEQNVKTVIDAIRKKDFVGLGDVIMRDSNNMHATMLDTNPPIMYLNDISKEIIYAITDLNAAEGRTIAAYTFDAGPNAHIITTKKDVQKVRKALEGIEGVERTHLLGIGGLPETLKDVSLITEGILKTEGLK